MAPDQESQTRTEQPEASISAESPRPARRSGRGRRGRGRHRKQRPVGPEAASVGHREPSPAEETPLASDEPRTHLEPLEPRESEPEVESQAAPAEHEPFHEPEEFHQPRQHPAEPPPPSRQSQPGPRLTIQKAIDEVNQIAANLKETQELMDEVLEMLEQFERQGNADERELESLRRALRHLQRPRDGGHSQRGRQ